MILCYDDIAITDIIGFYFFHVGYCLYGTMSEQELLKASEEGNLAQVEELLQRRISVNCRNRYDRTPLSLASINGHFNVVQCLIDAKAGLNTRDVFDETPLSRASLNGHLAAIGYLVEARAALNTHDPYGRTPLFRASESGRTDVVQYLARAKASLDTPDSDGRTPLFRAVTSGHLDVVQCLVKAGAWIYACYNKQTPLDIPSKNHVMREALMTSNQVWHPATHSLAQKTTQETIHTIMRIWSCHDCSIMNLSPELLFLIFNYLF